MISIINLRDMICEQSAKLVAKCVTYHFEAWERQYKNHRLELVNCMGMIYIRVIRKHDSAEMFNIITDNISFSVDSIKNTYPRSMENILAKHFKELEYLIFELQGSYFNVHCLQISDYLDKKYVSEVGC